jgi:hypothetical protein
MLQQIYIKHRCLLVSNACSLHASLTIQKLNSKAAVEFDVEVFIKLTTIEISSLTDVFCFPFLFISSDLILAEGNSSSLSINQGTTFITGPYLDGNGISNITTQISTHAYLPCKVSYTILRLFILIAAFLFSTPPASN